MKSKDTCSTLIVFIIEVKLFTLTLKVGALNGLRYR